MKLLKADRNTKSAAEYAALEAENNRQAVRELRKVLRLFINHPYWSMSDVILQCRLSLNDTTPHRLRGEG